MLVPSVIIILLSPNIPLTLELQPTNRIIASYMNETVTNVVGIIHLTYLLRSAECIRDHNLKLEKK
jgi:hypothetical protein